MIFQKNVLAALLTCFTLFCALPIAVSQSFSVVISIDQAIDCPGGQTGRLTASAPAGGPSITYQWSNDATGATVDGLGAGTYSVTATSVTGGSVQASKTLTEPPALLASVQVDDIITCYNPSVEVNATATGGTSPYLFAWSNGDSGPSTTAFDDGTLVLAVTDAHGCLTEESATIQSNTTLPVLSGENLATITCSGGSTNLSMTCTNSSAVGYQWATADGHIVSGANSQEPAVDAPGTYIVVVTDFSNGCTATASSLVEANFLSTSASEQSPVMADPTASIDVTTTGGVPPYAFVWKDAASIPFASSEDLLTEIAGFYTLTATDANGCVVTLGPIEVMVVTGVLDIREAGIQVFPNPVSNTLTLSVTEQEAMAWQAFNAAGQLIGAGLAGSANPTVDVSDWQKGWYSFVFQHTRGTASVQVLVQ